MILTVLSENIKLLVYWRKSVIQTDLFFLFDKSWHFKRFWVKQTEVNVLGYIKVGRVSQFFCEKYFKLFFKRSFLSFFTLQISLFLSQSLIIVLILVFWTIFFVLLFQSIGIKFLFFSKNFFQNVYFVEDLNIQRIERLKIHRLNQIDSIFQIDMIQKCSPTAQIKFG